MDPIEISQALEATELALLGAAITSSQHLSKISATLRDTDFRKGWPRCLIEAIHSEIEEHGAIEKLSLARRIENNHQNKAAVETVERAIAAASNDQDIDGHIRLVLEAGVNRRVSDLARKLAKDPSLAEVISREIHEEKARLFVKKKDSHINAVLTRCVERIQFLQDNNGKLAGLGTGFIDIDKATNGFEPGDLVIVAGRPSMGKSVFAQNLAENCAIALGLPTLIISCEMSDGQFGNRLIASQGQISLSALRDTNGLTEDQWARLSVALGNMHDSPLFIEDSTIYSTVSAIRYKAEEIKRQHGTIGLIVIDYLQLLQSSKSHDRKDLEIGEISRALKFLAKDLGTVVVALSQLSRKVEERTDKRPMMSDLRESGAIEQDADVIMLLYRDEYYKPDSQDKGTAEVIIAKNRNGEVGTHRLAFIGEYQHFKNLAFNTSNSAQAGKKNGPSF
jgi:replicative DNA helicase